ncbi:MAG TPA: agmatinase family protein [Clostridiaceae bacterium]|nr:agmatinase family protein [Clostridiaceae bacterium]
MSKPVCYDAERIIPEIYIGVPSFLGLPVCKDSKELDQYDLTFMGVPWEGTCTYGGHSNCEQFVKTIREASIRYGAYLPEYDIDAFDYFTGCDFGDSAVQNGNYARTSAFILEKYQSILDNNSIPIVFGGDHSISPPLIDAFALNHGKRIGILHFDCHLDNLNDYAGDPYARCTPFRRLYESENIDPTRIVHLGIRGPRNTPEGMRIAREVGATVITINELKDNGWRSTIHKALDIVKNDTDAFYVSVCSDITDVAFNPEGAVDACGVSSYELGRMLFECGLAGAKSFDYVEVYPDSDGRNVSSHLACYMVVNFLCGLAMRKRDEG